MIKFYNTLTRKKESFTPTNNSKVTMYNCGPTVYSRLTIGNLRTYVFSDALRRFLEYRDYEVKQVMNITDVGHLTMTDEQKKANNDAEITDTDDGLDRMEKAAKRENMTVWEVAEYYTDLFMQDIKELNLKIPEVLPRATEHIKEQIEMIQVLVDKGYAYVTQSAVYFDTSKFPAYSALAGQDLDEKLEAVRTGVEKDDTKKNPADFRLWQLNQPDHSMQWDSPWGKGYPGWHIECSAMSLAYLQQPIDIHTGGVDHIPVHHTNEIAQSEAATGKQFVKYWMHGAFLRVEGKRMGKSLGNAYTLEDINKKGFSAMDLRYFYLTAHYRQTLNFTWEALEAAKLRLGKIKAMVSTWKSQKLTSGKILSNMKKKFVMAASDDLNMPNALAVVAELIDSDEKNEDKLATLLDFDRVLGLNLAEISPLSEDLIEEIDSLIKQREELRISKQWEEADAIRDKLSSRYNVVLEDLNGETNWRLGFDEND